MLQADVVIVGSGAGGATLAKELSQRGKKVAVLEKGSFIERWLGTSIAALRFYDVKDTKGGVRICRAIAAGGSTMVSLGCCVKTLEKELRAAGIHLDEEFEEAKKELRVTVADELIGRGTRRIMEAAEELGYTIKPMPKFMDPEKCVDCPHWNCVFGCPRDAKWTALEYLDQAKRDGASIFTNVTVTEVLTSEGRAVGVRGIGPKGEIRVSAKATVLAAGGIGTPVILRRSGITGAGNGLFVDIFVTTYGITKDIGLAKEVGGTALIDEFSDSRGFILFPFITPKYYFIAETFPHVLRFFSRARILGILTKIKDECVGKITEEGTIEKAVTSRDANRLNEGASIAGEILLEAGANPKSIITTKPHGPHPGGTAAIGEVVDTNQETEIERLFISDASVLPAAPGAPPILTIVALSKRLSKKLTSEYLR